MGTTSSDVHPIFSFSAHLANANVACQRFNVDTTRGTSSLSAN